MITSNLQILWGSLCDSLAGYPAPFPFLSLNKERKGTSIPREGRSWLAVTQKEEDPMQLGIAGFPQVTFSQVS